MQGMVQSAEYIYNKIISEDLLSLAYNCDQDQGTHKYPLVTTGHSLGAGTATILAFLLRDSYPDTRVTCYAYSPPGGLLSQPAALESEKFTVSVVVGDDVIPRLSLTNIGALSRDIKQAISMCNLPKYQVFGYGCMACCCKREIKPLYEELERLYPTLTNNSHDPSESILNESHEELISTSTVQVAATRDPPSLSVLLSMPPMYLPGRVIHITEAPGSCYSVTERNKLNFQKILVSPTMLSDHFPNCLDRVLQSCPDSINLLPVLV